MAHIEKRLAALVFILPFLFSPRVCLSSTTTTSSARTINNAQCVLLDVPGGSTVSGTIKFHQVNNVLTVTGEVTGLNAGEHGFHIHTVGSTADNCAAAKGHYNPFSLNHGAPTANVRHVGDLGNIKADAGGKATVYIQDTVASLNGEQSIVGRTLVIHADRDDLGLGGNAGSLATGNAGARIACCIIGVVD